jgi:hypothetical protein
MAMKSAVMRMPQMLLWISLSGLAACGGSSGGMSSSGNAQSAAQACTNCSSAVVSITDAPGDFVSYIVNVVSLQLKRADGTVVETVPVTTQVDFAQLVDLSEIISAEQIPAGTYVSATMTLDYNGSTIVVDNGTTGVTIAAANIINGASSTPLTAPNSQITVSLNLGTNNQLIVAPPVIANLALDFNLAASNSIAPSNTSPTTVTVNPVLTASVAPDPSKQIRVRGSFVSAGADSFVIGVRPFFNTSGTAGQLTVDSSASTTYSISNANSSGSAGLAQLAGLAAGTMIVAYGTWNASTHSFTASSVLAGSSVPGTTQDGVEGTLLSRTGNVLVVANGVICHASAGGVGFARQVTATLAAATTVTEEGQSGAFSIQDLSVGQHVQLSGTLGTDSSGDTTLDASAGSARLMLTTVTGLITSLASDRVTISLDGIGGVAPPPGKY